MNIKEVPSPNFTPGRKAYKPEAIVIHIMEGTLTGTDTWFSTPASKVSAHYGIGLNGEIHRYVKEQNTAWHAGRVDAPSWSQIKKTANGLYINPNYYTIGIEHEGNTATQWSDAMYRASSALIDEIATRWSIAKDRDHVVGHHEIYSLKTCPGSRVDFGRLLNPAVVAPAPASNWAQVKTAGVAITKLTLNIRPRPDTTMPPLKAVPPNTQLPYVAYTDNGENIHGNSTWFLAPDGNWFWKGGIK